MTRLWHRQRYISQLVLAASQIAQMQLQISSSEGAWIDAAMH